MVVGQRAKQLRPTGATARARLELTASKWGAGAHLRLQTERRGRRGAAETRSAPRPHRESEVEAQKGPDGPNQLQEQED